MLLAIARERIGELSGRVPFDLDKLGAVPPVTAAPTVAGSRSRVLWDVLEAAYARLGFDTVGNDTFRRLVLARVVEPTSKADTLRVWGELGVPAAPSLSTVWRTLARAVEQDWRSQLAEAAYAHATRNGPLTVVLYDCTTVNQRSPVLDSPLSRIPSDSGALNDLDSLVALAERGGLLPEEVRAVAAAPERFDANVDPDFVQDPTLRRTWFPSP